MPDLPLQPMARRSPTRLFDVVPDTLPLVSV